ncbi:hypothetical protein SDJN02_03103, partial [Cucurbita argyrosperma subsp. argyrosperma]
MLTVGGYEDILYIVIASADGLARCGFDMAFKTEIGGAIRNFRWSFGAADSSEGPRFAILPQPISVVEFVLMLSLTFGLWMDSHRPPKKLRWLYINFMCI